jgi:hypothetical protein
MTEDLKVKTKHPIAARTVGGLSFVIPAGSPVHPARLGPTETAPRFWVSPAVFPRNSIERHDATYYGVSVTAADVED